MRHILCNYVLHQCMEKCCSFEVMKLSLCFTDMVWPKKRCLPVISANGCLCSWLDIRPGTHVLVLFLHPTKFCIAVLLRNLLHDIKWERTDLLNCVNGDLVIKALVSSFFDEVIVNLSCAEKHLE